MSDEQRQPDFSDADLLAYLDGETDETLTRAIEASADVRQRLEELAREDRRLAVGLYRSTCPDAHELGEYELALLPGERAALVAQHVAQCPHCALELQELRAFLREAAADLEYTFLERVRVLVARLVPDLPAAGGGPVPALAGMRGATNGPLFYDAGDVQVSLDVQDDAAGGGRKSVLGLITGVDPAGWQAMLWREDGQEEARDAIRAETVTVDELGNFVFEALHPGSYQLILRGGELEVVIQDLAVT